MKDLVLAMGVLCFFAMSCNNAPKQAETEAVDSTAMEIQKECPMKALRAEFANWDNLADSAKVAIVTKAKTMLDARFAEKKKCQHEMDSTKPCMHQEMAEMTEEVKAQMDSMRVKMEEMKAQWANFANLTLDEQKDIIVSHLEKSRKHECHKEGEARCKHDSISQ
ncbi:MAG: hypothetical protein ACTTKO_08535 [Candidatus Limimorpha sp.]